MTGDADPGPPAYPDALPADPTGTLPGPAGPEPPSVAAPPPLASPPWGLATAVGVVVATALVILGAGVGARLLGETDLGAQELAMATGLVLGGAYVVIIGLVWSIARLRGARLTDAVGWRRYPFWRTVGIAFIVSLAGRFAAAAWSALLQAAGVDVPFEALDPTRLMPDGTLGVVMAFALAVVLAPIGEEIVFRGVVLNAVAERFGPRAGVIVSALVFAAFHPSIWVVVPIFVLALMMGSVYLYSRSLWVPIATHALFNAGSLVALYALKGAGLL